MKKYAESTLKGYKKEFLIEIIRCLEHNIEVLEERNNNQFKLLMQKEQYAWHDLQKNPNDLPKDGVRILFCAKEYPRPRKEYFTGKYRTGYYFETDDTGDYAIDYELDEVIAWKEIEPFEEVEK